MTTRLATIGLALLATFALFVTGCSHVAPYERQALAHPMMAASLDGPAAGHASAVHEGAIGGHAGAESGCGCN